MNLSLNSTPRQQIALIAGICIASFVGCLDFTIVNTALPAIQQHFPAGLDAVQWVMTLFVIALCCCMVLATRLADRYGKREVLYGGMLLFTLASLSAGLSVSLPMLVVSRLIQGAGCAVLYTATAAILVESIAESQRGRALGLLFAANGLGLTLGPVAGGVLVELLGWRAVFLINVPLMAFSYFCCRGTIAGKRDEGHIRVDYPGWLLLIGGLVPLLLLSVYLSDWGAFSLASLLLLAISLASLLLFVRYERRTASPLIQLSVLSNRLFRRACGLSILLAVFYCSAFLLMPFKLLELYSLNAAQLGVMLLPVTLVMALVSPLTGKFSDRYGPWPVLAVGFVMLALSGILQSRFSAPPSLPLTIVAFVLMGAGWGAILGPSVAAALASLPETLHGQGIGISWTLHNLGGALGLTVATQIYQRLGTETGYSWVMVILALLSLLGAGLAFVSWRSTRRKLADAATGAE
ncbi:MFS transporter [Erwinia sp. JUb26]|uniref:MFS transporter n=1 Tax=Erwinia sp. JUb26 TaxID=2485126 RepID=UPI000F4715D6|nr:MFS transporter [Erwinia sp. JUb26]ROR10068.1 EmrB/QacA subfamily drug resistance transporter [Erwinia sp. JUb26]